MSLRPSSISVRVHYLICLWFLYHDIFTDPCSPNEPLESKKKKKNVQKNAHARPKSRMQSTRKLCKFKQNWGHRAVNMGNVWLY